MKIYQVLTTVEEVREEIHLVTAKSIYDALVAVGKGREDIVIVPHKTTSRRVVPVKVVEEEEAS